MGTPEVVGVASKSMSVRPLLNPPCVGCRAGGLFNVGSSLMWKAGQWVLHSAAGNLFGRDLAGPDGEKPGLSLDLDGRKVHIQEASTEG